VKGGLFSVGDTHAAQGDGEVCGTAIAQSDMGLSEGMDVRFHVRTPGRHSNFLISAVSLHLDTSISRTTARLHYGHGLRSWRFMESSVK
jgi:hypothetical protein